MSSEGKDPGPIWQGATNWGQEQAFEHFQHEEFNEPPSIPPAQRAGGPQVSTPLLDEDVSDQSISQEESLSLFDRMKQWGARLVFVLIPLLFGVLIGLIVL
ncbi:MAG: hypothetical protein J2P37_11210, partial [Ktedonobacteraceae bacterium]|nr:hypothetical protein [Ktedonobacteraceae bacterium]